MFKKMIFFTKMDRQTAFDFGQTSLICGKNANAVFRLSCNGFLIFNQS